jgi:hypothetical protein
MAILDAVHDSEAVQLECSPAEDTQPLEVDKRGLVRVFLTRHVQEA